MALEQITFNIGAFNDANAGGNNYYSNTVFEVKRRSDNTFAAIYSDPDGLYLIPQNSIDNRSNSDGECIFYVDTGNYYIEVDSKKRNFNTTGITQDFIDSFALKIFQSPTDGGLTEIQTRTFDGGEVYEVRKTSDDSLATIYSDAAGTAEIVQNGTSNVSDSDGVVEFYVDKGEYSIGVGVTSAIFKVGELYLSNICVSEISKINTLENQFSLKTNSSSLKSYATGFSESSSLSADYSFSKLDGGGVMSTVPSENHAWLSSATGNEWVGVNMPFAVIIGDSIAEGHPNLHGRLHQSYENPTFNSSVLNQYGQPSYELSRRTRLHWYNHGIGGQTTADVLARFDRDALGDSLSVGDGRPNQTLPRQPLWVWVNAGINDVSALTDTAETKANLLEMCAKARRRGLNIGFNTIGPVNSHNATQRAMQDDINEFILSTLPQYGAYTFDFHNWFVDPSDATRINPIYDADGVHPNKSGYTNYVARLLDNPELPIYFNGVFVETGIGESISSNFTRPTAIEFEDGRGLQGEIELSSSVEFVNPDIMPLTSASVKVYIKNVLGGVDPAKNSGFTNITTVVGKKAQFTPVGQTDKSLVYGAHIAKVGGTWQVIASNNNVGVSSISSNTTEVTVTFDSVIRNPTAGMIGTSTPSVYSAVADGANASSCRVKSFDLIDGSQRDMTTVADGLGFWVSAIKA